MQATTAEQVSPAVQQRLNLEFAFPLSHPQAPLGQCRHCCPLHTLTFSSPLSSLSNQCSRQRWMASPPPSYLCPSTPPAQVPPPCSLISPTRIPPTRILTIGRRLLRRPHITLSSVVVVIETSRQLDAISTSLMSHMLHASPGHVGLLHAIRLYIMKWPQTITACQRGLVGAAPTIMMDTVECSQMALKDVRHQAGPTSNKQCARRLQCMHLPAKRHPKISSRCLKA
jgi:hypothetical protein